MVNGHAYPEADQHDWGTSFAERPLLFHNQEGKKFTYVPPVKGSGLAVVIPARGAAFGDLFNDGKIDVIINSIDGPPTLLRNVNPDHHHSVELNLVGGTNSPRDATCAGLPQGQPNAHAPGRARQRQLYLVERSAAAPRTWRCG